MNRISLLIERFDPEIGATVTDELMTGGVKCVINYLYPEVVRDYLGNICTRAEPIEIKKRIIISGIQQEPQIQYTDKIKLLIEHQTEMDFHSQMAIKEIPVVIASQQLKLSAAGEFSWEIVLEEK